MLGTPIWSGIWLLGTPKWNQMSILEIWNLCHKVAMSVCLSVFVSVCLSVSIPNMVFSRPVIGPQIAWSVSRPLIACPLPPRNCSRLDAWIVPVFCSGLSPNGALKTRTSSRLDKWVVPAYCSGSSLQSALKTRRSSGLDACIVSAFCYGSSPRGAFKIGGVLHWMRGLAPRSVTDCPCSLLWIVSA